MNGAWLPRSTASEAFKVTGGSSTEALPSYRAVAFRLDVRYLGKGIAPVSYLLTRRCSWIGRGPDNDVRLLSVRRMVSVCHLTLFYKEGVYWVRDLGSIRGTSRNGERLAQGGVVALSDGDVLQVGDFLLTFLRMDQLSASHGYVACQAGFASHLLLASLCPVWRWDAEAHDSTC